MRVFGKRPGDYLFFLRWGLFLMALMATIRFLVGVSGVPYDRATDLVSLTILTFLLAVIYGQMVADREFGSYRHLVPVAALLSLAMYGLIIVAMLVEGLLGIRGYFHAPGYGYTPAEMALRDHVLGQLSVMGTMTVAILGTALLGFALSRHLRFLGSAVLLLSGVAAARFLAGPTGVPYAIGTWLTSLTLAGGAVAAYAGYRAPAKGFSSYKDLPILTFVVLFVVTHLVAYGIAVTDGLGIATYFHTPGTITKHDHIVAHLWFSPWLGLSYLVLGTAGFLFGKRGRVEAASASPPVASSARSR